jgi:hypothetical protein
MLKALFIHLGFRSLLNQLVQLQSTNLMISRQHLGVEKQRLSVERTLGEQMILSLQSIQKIFEAKAATTSVPQPSVTSERPRRAKKPRIQEETSDDNYSE